MAKSKKRKRMRQGQASFYEAMPAAVTPPIGLPHGRKQLQASTAALAELTRLALVAAGRYTGAQLIRVGLLMAQGLIHAGRLTWNGARLAGTFVRASANAAGTYGPALAADAAAAARHTRGLVTSRRARITYLAITGSGLLAVVGVGLATASATMASYAHDISSPAALLAKKKTGTTVLDRNGQVLFEGYGAQSTKVVPLSQIPQHLKDATLAAEDPSFYDHPGFSWRGTARAAWVDISHRGKVEGGSTLTQQLVKYALLTSNKTFERKYQELLLSMELERRYSKDQILEMYLNEIYYGQGSSGVEAASQTYFHKPVANLSLGESALIAGLPLGPSRFDPNFDLSAATGRRNYVLDRMATLGKISRAEAAAAKTQPIALAGAGAPTPAPDSSPMLVYPRTTSLQAPHFVFYVLDQLRRQYGDDAVEQGGITVRTTLDLTKQRTAEASITTHISELAAHHVTNGALISLEPGSGNIVAMVGSVDYNAPGFGNVNVTLSERQPGSSFKPFAYATAFKKGWNGATTVDDVPSAWPNGDGTLYTPQNYDGQFHGRVTLRHALDNSLNIPAVKVLQFAGIHDTIQTAHDLGVTSLKDENRFGLALVLGGGEVSPLDMATAYGTFANGGTRVEPRAILQVTDRLGKDITQPPATKPQAVLDPRIAYMITSILSDDSSRQPEFPANGPLHLSRPAAAKTGTTNDFRDNWTVGYTPQLVTAVWVGNNDNTPMENVDGITGAAPVWSQYMETAMASLPVQTFQPPAGITMAKVCSADGGLANPWDTGREEAFMSDAMPTKHCATFAKPPAETKPEPDPSTPTTPTVPLPHLDPPFRIQRFAPTNP